MKILVRIMKRALVVDQKIASYEISVNDDVLESIALLSQGDARFALNTLEMAIETAKSMNEKVLDLKTLQASTSYKPQGYRSEEHYDFASAFIKSLRGSDPDAACIT